MSVEWFYQINGDILGPVSAMNLRALAISRLITKNTYVRRGDVDRWVQAEKVKGLFDVVQTEVRSAPKAEEVTAVVRTESVASVAASGESKLISCPDCDRPVSKKAFQCPHCGRPLQGPGTEARLTVGRVYAQSAAIWPISILVDGKEMLKLANGKRGSCKVSPGKHKLLGRIGWGIFGAQCEIVIDIPEGKHLQLEVNPFSGLLMNKMTFRECIF